MSNVLFWVRNNLVVVICIAVMVVCVGAGLIVAGAQGSSFQKELDQSTRVVSQIRSFNSQELVIPTEPPVEVPTAINEKDVAALAQIFEKMNDGYEDLTKATRQFNIEGGNAVSPHKPLSENLFPVPRSDSVLYDARDAYFRGCNRLYEAIGAGQPPSEAEIDQALDEVKRRFDRDRNVLPTIGDSSSNNDPELLERQAREKLKLIINRARSLQVYAQPLVRTGNKVSPGIFAVGVWATQEEKPNMADVWEGQMQAWIQQDLMLSIWLANQLEQAGDEPINVFKVPVKRIVSMSIEPGYVGLDAQAGASGSSSRVALSEPIEQRLNSPLPSNFIASPTGRITNDLYDVRHARLSVVIDARQIPRLLNAITRVNLMTPIIEKITAVDQAVDFAQGYIYGDRIEVVRLDLLIETLWLRSWTAGSYDKESADRMGEPFEMGLMPDAVRAKLGLPTRDPNFRDEGVTEPAVGGF